jgi:hypothetical protein
MAFSYPTYVMDDGGGVGFDAAVIGINCLRPADRRIREVLCPLLGHEQFNVFSQRALIAFQSEHVISLHFDDLLCDRTLTSIHHVAALTWIRQIIEIVEKYDRFGKRPAVSSFRPWLSPSNRIQRSS